MRNVKMGAFLAAAFSLTQPALAGPYFRLVDPQHPHMTTGAYLDPADPGQTEAGVSLALITHSPRDGRLIDSMPTDWSPLTVGGSMNHGDLFFSIGPSFNLSEPIKWVLRGAFNALADQDKYENLRGLLAPAKASVKDATIAISPSWVVRPNENFKGYFRLYIGPKWSF